MPGKRAGGDDDAGGVDAVAVIQAYLYRVDAVTHLERALAYGELRGVGVALQRACSLPGLRGAQSLGGGLGPDEVRDAAASAGEAGHARVAQGLPDLLALRLLGVS